MTRYVSLDEFASMPLDILAASRLAIQRSKKRTLKKRLEDFIK